MRVRGEVAVSDSSPRAIAFNRAVSCRLAKHDGFVVVIGWVAK